MRKSELLITGDVIYATCEDMILCHHVGIFCNSNGKNLVYHNSPYNKNKFGGSVCVEDYETFMKGRDIIKIHRTGVTRQDIVRQTFECSRRVWDSLFFNCEDYVSQIVDKEPQSDIRDAYKVAVLGILIMAIF
jgi:hypothetical protein